MSSEKWRPSCLCLNVVTAMQILRRNHQPRGKLWTNQVLWDFSFRENDFTLETIDNLVYHIMILHITHNDKCSISIPLQWCHNGCNGISNYQRLDCLLNRLFRRRSKKTSMLCITGLREGNSPVTGEFPAQRASNMKMFPYNDIIMIEKLLLPGLDIPAIYFTSFNSKSMHFNPRLPSVLSGIVVIPCVTCLSIHQSVCLKLVDLRISAIGLNFGGMTQSTMEQITVWNGHAQPFYACSIELYNFSW